MYVPWGLAGCRWHALACNSDTQRLAAAAWRRGSAWPRRPHPPPPPRRRQRPPRPRPTAAWAQLRPFAAAGGVGRVCMYTDREITHNINTHVYVQSLTRHILQRIST